MFFCLRINQNNRKNYILLCKSLKNALNKYSGIKKKIIILWFFKKIFVNSEYRWVLIDDFSLFICEKLNFALICLLDFKVQLSQFLVNFDIL